jgi:hypothetical protein
MKAQIDCGYGDSDEFELAVQWLYKFNHWSSSNGDYIFDCINRFHPDSYANILKSKL